MGADTSVVKKAKEIQLHRIYLTVLVLGALLRRFLEEALYKCSI